MLCSKTALIPETCRIVGKLVISSTFGVGRVVEISENQIDDRTFLVVQAEDKNLKNYIPMEDERSYRLIMSKEVINGAIQDLKAMPIKKFSSKKERISYFRNNSQVQDIKLFAKLLVELNVIRDRGTIENHIFKTLIDTLALEYSIVNKIEFENSKRFIIKTLAGDIW